jgi:hypothetical protein
MPSVSTPSAIGEAGVKNLLALGIAMARWMVHRKHSEIRKEMDGSYLLGREDGTSVGMARRMVLQEQHPEVRKVMDG